ncbi:TfdA family taurine catabolism dioxygenase TauD [Kribbella rubisoli]|uniref:TfdA family taurine catabolism dioxygenase TauD n=1 Tax=Kribbella rubisoli TaxID=3075929 RepID=A0A4Q7X1K9_9ACTN|nr:TauD/TfdA family dioxygenase [Kribbella rubisoli]RZU15989.1 TfdA family taurine catabolism dioxygenase TauD [Kribbella rubisoli]
MTRAQGPDGPSTRFGGATAADRLPPALDGTALSGEALRVAVQCQLDSAHIARVRDLPAQLDQFIWLISHWGEPLAYYGAGDPGAHVAHSGVHRVRFDPEAAARRELHALDGPLAAHSAQSLREPRPPYFAMLMVHQGWQDGCPGENGESVLVEWRRAFEALAHRHADRFAGWMETLMGEVPFPDGSAKALVYRLPDPASEYDLGVRLKYELLDHWRTIPTNQARRAEEALTALLAAAATVEHEVQLSSGECVIVDNNRWGHGRRSVRGIRSGAHGPEINPRELWSVTLG